MDQIICIENRFYIPATSTMADDRTRVLKHGETFVVFDRFGDIQQIGKKSQGLYHEGTRFLSQFELRLGSERPVLLSSTVKEDNALLAVDLTNPDIIADGCVVVPRGVLHLFRAIFLWQGVCYERLRVTNYGLKPIDITLNFRFDADFADIFEVRGTKREHKGRRLNELVRSDSVQLIYEGLDNVTRRTRVQASPKPLRMSSTQAVYETRLGPKEEASYFLTVSCETGDRIIPTLSYDQAYYQAEHAWKSTLAQECNIDSTNEQFNDWVNRSQPDLHMMITETAGGPYPYAGVPWFSCPFGRDGLITAIEYLWINPDLAKGVLSYLAATQATEVIPEQDAEPGKILHEARKGEMANLGEIPFKRYYGSVDSTPLFVMLAGAHWERTGDRELLESLWPHVERALGWIDTYGDQDGDGFVEYFRRSPNGLVNQGWKDSHDSVFHADGSQATGPIALCEVQGYVYESKLGAARMARAMGRQDRADELVRQAEELRGRFLKNFWCEEIGMYALALDGDKRPCKVRSSNAGHCLLTGLATPEHARRMGAAFLEKDMFSGWGIRTLSMAESRYNPISYHNGSIWPHDNAMIAMGLSRYGLKEEALQVLSAIYDATLFLDLHRLPELYCGFVRRPGEGPGLYPVACAPQAWAVASVFLLLQACLGIEIDGQHSRMTFTNPCLPEFLPELRIKNFRIGAGTIDLLFERHPHDVSISTLRKDGNIELIIRK